MTREEILKNMDVAIRQDRERFFRVADTLHLQPKYADKVFELDEIKQQWRDITGVPGYPNITHPMPLPEWFPTVHFASSFEKDTFLEEALALTEDKTE